MKSLLIFSAWIAALIFTVVPKAKAQESDFDLYEIRIYHLEDDQQEERVDQYLKEAYLPALERAGIEKTGVFKPVETDTSGGSQIYVFIPYTSAKQYLQIPQQVAADEEYHSSGSNYLNASHDDAPYERVETILLRAFEGSPHFQENNLTGEPSERIYELRSYESATEELFKNKVRMFNEGEIDIFDRLGFNAIFYGEVLAGSRMPNLMYMTSFENMEARNKHWEAFGQDPAWEQMSGMEEYQDNVSHIDITLLRPASYSQL